MVLPLARREIVVGDRRTGSGRKLLEARYSTGVKDSVQIAEDPAGTGYDPRVERTSCVTVKCTVMGEVGQILDEATA
jgi:hypothetical protein